MGLAALLSRRRSLLRAHALRNVPHITIECGGIVLALYLCAIAAPARRCNPLILLTTLRSTVTFLKWNGSSGCFIIRKDMQPMKTRHSPFLACTAACTIAAAWGSDAMSQECWQLLDVLDAPPEGVSSIFDAGVGGRFGDSVAVTASFVAVYAPGILSPSGLDAPVYVFGRDLGLDLDATLYRSSYPSGWETRVPLNAFGNISADDQMIVVGLPFAQAPIPNVCYDCGALSPFMMVGNDTSDWIATQLAKWTDSRSMGYRVSVADGQILTTNNRWPGTATLWSFAPADGNAWIPTDDYPIHPSGLNIPDWLGDVVLSDEAAATSIGREIQFYKRDPVLGLQYAGQDTLAGEQSLIVPRLDISGTLIAIAGDAYVHIYTYTPAGTGAWTLATTISVEDLRTFTGEPNFDIGIVAVDGTDLAVASRSTGLVVMLEDVAGPLPIWVPYAVIEDPVPGVGSHFGHSIDLRDGVLAIGAPATAVDGVSVGRTYIFTKACSSFSSE